MMSAYAQASARQEDTRESKTHRSLIGRSVSCGAFTRRVPSLKEMVIMPFDGSLGKTIKNPKNNQINLPSYCEYQGKQVNYIIVLNWSYVGFVCKAFASRL